MLCEKDDRIQVRYEELSTFLAGNLQTDFKYKHGKTFSDFASLWDARQFQTMFEHLLNLGFQEGELEISQLKVEHRLVAARVETMYVKVVEFSVRRAKFVAVAWNYDTSKKATNVDILEFISEVITSRYKRSKEGGKQHSSACPASGSSSAQLSWCK